MKFVFCLVLVLVCVVKVKCKSSLVSNEPVEELTEPISQKKVELSEEKLNPWSVDSLLQIFQKSSKVGFIHAFIASLSVIIVSELGDKTFFIAAILAMHHSRLVVFLGAMTALVVMTTLSAFLGYATTVIPRIYTHYVSVALFVAFGLKMLKDGYYLSPQEGQAEYEEVQKSIIVKETEYTKSLQNNDVESGISKEQNTCWLQSKLKMCFSRVFLESLTMTFLGEWGDRSQLTTILLAAREDTYGVVFGALVGHGGCTALAVIGGRFIAQRISVRTVTILGGIIFLMFGIMALLMGPN